MGQPQVQNQNTTPKVRNHQVGGARAQSGGFKLDAGPAALSAKLMYEIMALYAEIIELDKKQRIAMLKAQKSEATCQATAVENSGKAAAAASRIQGWTAIAGAGVQVGMIIASNVAMGRGIKASQNALKEKMAPLEHLTDKAPTIEPEHTKAGRTRTQAETKKIIEEIKIGNYKNVVKPVKADEPTKAQTLTREGREALVEMKKNHSAAFEKFQRKIEADLHTHTLKHNSGAQRVNEINTTVSTTTQITSSAANGFGQTLSADKQADKGQQDAFSSLSGTAAQQAGSSASDYAQKMGKADQAIGNAARNLRELVQAGNGNR